jgi:hypothetical protein
MLYHSLQAQIGVDVYFTALIAFIPSSLEKTLSCLISKWGSLQAQPLAGSP